MFRASPLCSLLSIPSTLHLSLFSPHHSLFLFSPFSCPFSTAHIFFPITLIFFLLKEITKAWELLFWLLMGCWGIYLCFPEDPRKGMSGELVWSCLYFLGPQWRIRPQDLLRKFFSSSVVCRQEWGQRLLWHGCIASAGVSFLLQDRDPTLTLSSMGPDRKVRQWDTAETVIPPLALWLWCKGQSSLPSAQASSKAAPLHP